MTLSVIINTKTSKSPGKSREVRGSPGMSREVQECPGKSRNVQGSPGMSREVRGWTLVRRKQGKPKYL